MPEFETASPSSKLVHRATQHFHANHLA